LEKVYQPWGRSENSDPRLDGKIEGWLLKFPELLLAARRGVWLRYTPVGEWRKGQRSYEGGTNVEHETKQNRHRLIPQTSSGSTRFSVEIRANLLLPVTNVGKTTLFQKNAMVSLFVVLHVALLSWVFI